MALAATTPRATIRRARETPPAAHRLLITEAVVRIRRLRIMGTVQQATTMRRRIAATRHRAITAPRRAGIIPRLVVIVRRPAGATLLRTAAILRRTPQVAAVDPTVEAVASMGVGEAVHTAAGITKNNTR
jgi:hypothetical protein